MLELTNNHKNLNENGSQEIQELFKYRTIKNGICRKIFFFFFNCCRKENKSEKRYIFLNEDNQNHYPNIIHNQKYNILTLIPVVLFVQFSLFSNQFYLLMAISQLFDTLKVGFLFSYVAPLAFVLLITIFKEGYDDYYRFLRDKEANNANYIKINKYGKRDLITSADIQIGDIIEINQNERLPADIIVLKSYIDQNESLFIRTDQLDGETDWKLRKPLMFTQKFDKLEDIIGLTGCFIIDPPSREIYKFVGQLNIILDSIIIKEPISLENSMWANTVLASKKILGFVIHTGEETRARMNSSLPRSKLGILDLEINWINKVLFIIMLVSSFIIIVIKGFSPNILYNFLTFFRFVVLLCSIIPISLRVNLDISKTINSYWINKDENIPETIVRNSMIPEELGRIDYIFCDKTGTLTRNEMVFKRLAFEVKLFTDEDSSDLKLILEEDCRLASGPALDLINIEKFIDTKNPNKKLKRNPTKIIRDTISAMALCHNVTPTISENGEIIFQASSPDEVALVQTATRLGIKLIGRTDKEIKILNANQFEETYEVLSIFPFSSETKRMGIILRSKLHNHIIFYLKGAENVMLRFVKQEYQSIIKENAENLASTGLRTLVLAQKLIDQEFYKNWLEKYRNAELSMENRNDRIREVINLLENNLDFLAVSGVEDLLQEKVLDTIESFRNAGMKVWMLTGDKVETATCIAISTGLKSQNHRLFFIRDNPDIDYIRKCLLEFKQMNDSILIIDGDCLESCLKYLEPLFFEVSLKAPSVICCRCSPTQKAVIVSTVKKYTTKRTCAVGDGGNDVSMIQQANVGIGIVGKEGMQASLAADYSITKFMYLNILILWFGRISYKNTATISKFVIHRGLIISFIQFIFSIIFYCSAIPIYNGILILGYSTIFTNLPVISLLLDRDTEMKAVLDFPSLYKDLLKGRELSLKSFLWWFKKSLFQASVIMIGSIYLFEFVFLKIVTITFTCLILIELLNVYTEIRKFHKFMILSLLGTLITYFLCLMYLSSVLDVYYAIDLKIILKISILTLISWFPLFIYSKMREWIYPEAYEKLRN